VLALGYTTHRIVTQCLPNLAAFEVKPVTAEEEATLWQDDWEDDDVDDDFVG